MFAGSVWLPFVALPFRIRRMRLCFRVVRQVADVQHDLPDLVVRIAPSRHASEADTVLDDVEQLAIGLVRLVPQVRHFGVESGADFRVAQPVVAVADRAIVLEMTARALEVFRGGLQRVPRRLRRCRIGHLQQAVGNEPFRPAGLRFGGETAGFSIGDENSGADRDDDDKSKQEGSQRSHAVLTGKSRALPPAAAVPHRTRGILSNVCTIEPPRHAA
jgi:hypothetical protein